MAFAPVLSVRSEANPGLPVDRVPVINLATNPSFETASGTETVRTQLCTNPNFETDITGWTVFIGIDPPTRVTTTPKSGTGRLEAVGTGTSRAPRVSSGSYAGVAGDVFTISFWIRSDGQTPDNTIITFLKASVSEYPASAWAPGADGWMKVSASTTLGAGDTSVTIAIGVVTPANYATTDKLGVDEVLIEKSPVVGTYFDSSTPAAGDFSYALGAGGVSIQTAPGVAGMGGVSSLAKGYQSGEWSSSGAKSIRITPVSSNPDTFVDITAGFTLNPNTLYTILGTVRLEAPQTGTLNSKRRGFRAYIGGSETTFNYSSVAPNEFGVHEVRATFSTPASAVMSFFRLMNGASAGNGDVWWDDLLIIEGEYTGPYFDGSTPNTVDDLHAWDGPADASTSTRTWMGPVWTQSAGMPAVEVLFNSFAPGTTHVDVYRLAEGREYKVRSAVKAATAGALSRIDSEIPFGIPATFRAEMFDTAGMTLGFTDAATVQVDEPNMWAHNPLNPAGGVKVAFRGNAARDLSRPVDGATFYPQGRRVGVVISGHRRGLQGVTLDIIVDTVEDADKFAALVGDYSTTTVPVLCFRLGANDRVRLPRPLFAAVFDPREQDVNYVLGGSQIAFAMTGDEVSPPAPALVIPLLTRADINAFYATRAAVKADNISRLAVNRRYDLGGTA